MAESSAERESWTIRDHTVTTPGCPGELHTTCRISLLTQQTCPDRPPALHTTGAGDAAEATPPAGGVDQGTTVMRSVAVGVVGLFAVM